MGQWQKRQLSRHCHSHLCLKGLALRNSSVITSPRRCTEPSRIPRPLHGTVSPVPSKTHPVFPPRS